MIKSLMDFSADAMNRYYRRSTEKTGSPLLWEKLSFRIRRQELSIWSGYAGHGKSAFLTMLAIALALQGERTLIASLEMPADQTIARLLRQALGTSSASADDVEHCLQWLSRYIYIYDYVGRLNKQGTLLDHFETAHKELGITQYQVDSLLKLGMAEDDYNGQKRLVEDLHNFCMTHPSHVHLVAHSRKGEDENKVPGKMDVAHSGSIGQLANNGITVWRNKGKEESIAQGSTAKANEPDAILYIWKSRECGPEEEGKFGFWYHHGSMQYFERRDDQPQCYCTEMPF